MVKTLNRTTVNTTTRPVKILQFGEGNFLRGFVDWMIDILNETTDFDGDVQIVQPIKEGLGELINEQDGLYHTLLQGQSNNSEVNETRLITCVKGVINPHEDYQGYLDMAHNGNLRFIVSNTTEAGIAFDPNDTSHTTTPLTFPGKLTAFLWQRYSHFKGGGDKGLVLLPVELIDKNGEKLKMTILKYIELWQLPDEFRSWVINSNIFCNTLVDRIVPGFPKEEISLIQKRIGFLDNLVVKAEPFHLWVIQAPIAVHKTLPFSSAGLNVLFVDDIGPYRDRKVRILNGIHTAMVPFGYLLGLRTVKEAVETEPLKSFIRDTIYDEILPTLDLTKTELQKFAEAVMERFQNPFIRHELISIALNSISKFKVRVLPSIMEYYHIRQSLPKNLVKSLAALLVFYSGKYSDNSIPLKDSHTVLGFFNTIWELDSLEHIVREILSNTQLWGRDLMEIDGLYTAVVSDMLKLIKNN